jgi:hypothetical protein
MSRSLRGNLTHLERLEAESIHIFREVVSEVEKPVMLYSIGKDSAVMLHLASAPLQRKRRSGSRPVRNRAGVRVVRLRSRITKQFRYEILCVKQLTLCLRF